MEEELPQLKLQEMTFGGKCFSRCEVTVAQLAELTSHCPELQRLEVRSRDGKKVLLLSDLTDGWLEAVLRSMSCCPEIAWLELGKVAAVLKTMGQLRKKGSSV
jgi:hypothetical protein